MGLNANVANKGELLVKEIPTIPLLSNGLGVLASRTYDRIGTAPDITPTLPELYWLNGPPEPHRVSLAKMLSGKSKVVRDSLLVEHHRLHRISSSAVCTGSDINSCFSRASSSIVRP